MRIIVALFVIAVAAVSESGAQQSSAGNAAATKDDDFEVSGVRDCIAAARPVYELFGKQHNLEAIYPESKHDFPAEARKIAYEFLEKHLR